MVADDRARARRQLVNRRARRARHTAASCRARCGARSGTNGRPRPTCAAGERACRNGLWLLVRQGAPAVGDRIQRRAAPLRRELLRLAGVGSALVQFRRHRAGRAAAGKLVRSGAPAHVRGRRAGSAGVERLDVRIPDAAAGDADLREYLARPDVPGRSGTTDRLWTATRRAVGDVGVRLQHRRCPSQLPVPRLRSPRPGLETRPRPGSGRGTVRVRACPDGRARGGVPQPATACRPWIGRKAGHVRGHRLHAVAATSRGVERRGPVIHGAPPGDEPALLRLCPPGATDAEAIRIGPAVSGDPAASSGAHPESHAVSFEGNRSCRSACDQGRRSGAAGARACHPDTRRFRKCSCCRTAATT